MYCEVEFLDQFLSFALFIMLKYQIEYLLDSNIFLSIYKDGDSLESLRDWIKVGAFILTHLFIKMEKLKTINNNIDSIDVVKEYYGYSTAQTKQVLSLFDDAQLNLLKQKLQKGGRNAR